MRDLGLISNSEPAARLFTQGMVIKDGAKMSKSKGNVVDPDQMVERYGADTTRLFSLFAAPAERDLEWSEAGVEGCFRFLGRLWRTFDKAEPFLPPAGAPKLSSAGSGNALALRQKTHHTIRRVTDDLGPRMHLNTPVAAIMELVNELTGHASEPGARFAAEAAVSLVQPYAPHVAEELWQRLGHTTPSYSEPWPAANPALLTSDSFELVLQVNGKVRDRVEAAVGISQAEAIALAKASEKVQAHLAGVTIRKEIVVPGKLVNFVVRG